MGENYTGAGTGRRSRGTGEWKKRCASGYTAGVVHLLRVGWRRLLCLWADMNSRVKAQREAVIPFLPGRLSLWSGSLLFLWYLIERLFSFKGAGCK